MKRRFKVSLTFEALDRMLRQYSTEMPAGEIISVVVNQERDILEVKYIPHTVSGGPVIGEGGEVPTRGYAGLATAESIHNG